MAAQRGTDVTADLGHGIWVAADAVRDGEEGLVDAVDIQLVRESVQHPHDAAAHVPVQLIVRRHGFRTETIGVSAQLGPRLAKVKSKSFRLPAGGDDPVVVTRASASSAGVADEDLSNPDETKTSNEEGKRDERSPRDDKEKQQVRQLR